MSGNLEKSHDVSKQFILECAYQWGSSVVESILDPACQIFTIPEVKGLIGYHTNRGCAVAFGDPVCSPDDRMRLVTAFHAMCEDQKKNVVYLVASEEFARWMQENESSALITFGDELFLDPQSDPRTRTGKKGISLRGKLRHAEKNKLTVNEYSGENLDLERKIQEVTDQWLKSRQGPQIYTSRVRLFAERFGKRWFYAEQNGQIVGNVALNRLQAKQGWLLDRIITTPHAPQGTSELLVVSVMETIAREGCRFLTFGATNGTSLNEIAGFGKYTTYLVNHMYKASIKIFNIDQRGKYWDKFHPMSTPAYLVFRKPRLGFHELRGVLSALNVSLLGKS